MAKAAVLVIESIVLFSSRRRHTRFDCDWSSDVCSSDLVDRLGPFPNIDDPTRCVIIRGLNPGGMAQLIVGYLSSVRPSVATNGIAPFTHDEIGRASCRERV